MGRAPQSPELSFDSAMTTDSRQETRTRQRRDMRVYEQALTEHDPGPLCGFPPEADRYGDQHDSRYDEERETDGPDQPRSRPSTRPSSARASAGSTTLIVVIPMALAGLRLMPRSSRNTASVASTPTMSRARR